MANQLDETARPTPVRWRWVLVGGALALATSVILGMAGAAIGSVPAAALLAALAYLLAGGITRLINPLVQPRDPAIGAAIMTAVASAAELAAARRRIADLPPGRLLLSWALSVAFGYALTWAGARLVENSSSLRRRARDGRRPRPEARAPLRVIPPPEEHPT